MTMWCRRSTPTSTTAAPGSSARVSRPVCTVLTRALDLARRIEHNLALLTRCGCFHQLESPLLVGHSRKGFIAKVLGDPHVDRTAGTVGVALSLARQGVQIIRVHDAAPVRDLRRRCSRPRAESMDKAP